MEKSPLANSDDSFFAIPNVLFSAAFPVVPIMNPTDKPRYICKGEAVGLITDPDKFLDTPKSEEHRSKMEAHTTSLAFMIHSMVEADKAQAEARSAERSTDDSDAPAKPKVEINKMSALLAGSPEGGDTNKDS